MGYQVGNTCYQTLEDAENVYFSAVSPVIKFGIINHELIKPEYNGKNWTLQGKVIHANFNHCDPYQNFKDGLSIGWLFVLLASVAYSFVLIRRVIR